MKLDLIKNNLSSEVEKAADEKTIRFDFFKNFIKKDLEVVLWQNKAVKVFGEFQIYSDFRSELNSFDYIVSYLTGSTFEYSGESIEAYISCKCPEHFLNFLISQNYNFDENEIEKLSSKYTSYIVEACDLFTTTSSEKLQKLIIGLDKKYFGGNDPTAVWKYISPQYLN